MCWQWPKPKVLIVIIVLGGIAFGPLRYAVSRFAAPLGVGTFLGTAKEIAMASARAQR